ncbi:Phage-related protein [Pseudomonas chlororaphis subsp. aureofaciens]|uniref:hypothetical protein n=1 Tax=Pseudomonas chlororaphis TaxID=587753 RepID=UPI000F563F79|nr:hypothetical protein [Pseudomonas chlororaphis]AZD85018.1 Phage-related protein [Pseudomonas chlororaphis subsp. aureofaciens]
MASFEYITSTGVVVPDTAEIQAEVISEWKASFGQDLDVGPETPQGVMITAEVETRDNVARNNADLANQINPDQAGGIFLDAIWSLTRGGRLAATRSQAVGVVLGGQPGTIIQAGARASVEGSGDLFELADTVIIGPNQEAIGAFQSVEFGPIKAAATQLKNIVTGVLGWETVSNPANAIEGRLQESDIAARRRRRNTLALQSVAMPEATISRLYDTEGVDSLSFRENITNTPQTIDGVLLKPHSVYACVDGGSDQAVAEALLASKSLGSGWNGAVTVNVLNEASGQTYVVQFDRPQVVPVFIRVTAKYNNVDGQTIIPNAVMRYVNGGLEGDPGFVVGNDVSPFELAGAVNQVEPRIFVRLVEISTDGVTWQSNALSISIQQKAQTTLGSIQVIPA